MKPEGLTGSHFEHIMRDKSLSKAKRTSLPGYAAGPLGGWRGSLGIGDDAALVGSRPGEN